MRHFFTFTFACTLTVPFVLSLSCCTPELSPAFSAEAENCLSQATIRRAWGNSTGNFRAKAFIYKSEDGALDAFQDLESTDGTVEIRSTSGVRDCLVVENLPDSIFSYGNISNINSLLGMKVSYLDEDPQMPVCTGSARYDSRVSAQTQVNITPLLARIEIRNLRVDFSAQPYSNAAFEDPKAYLTNLNGICPLSGSVDKVSEILNYGSFDYQLHSRMRNPQMIMSRNPKGAVLYCYPHPAQKDPDHAELGECITRLVIEARIEGKIYYYPVCISKDGIHRGVNYVFDITICGKGCLDADTLADAGMIRFDMVKKEWNEKEYQNEIF